MQTEELATDGLWRAIIDEDSKRFANESAK